MKLWHSFPAFRLTVVLALVVALVGTAWAHRGPSIEITEDVLAYVAAGGSLEDICASKGSAEIAHQACDACRLVDAVSLAGVSDSALPQEVIAQTNVLLPGADETHIPIHDMVRHPRAPPRLI